MSVKSKEEIMESVKAVIGDNESEEVISLLEDLSDTLDSKEGDGTDWKAKYEQNDSEWKKKYRDRFFSKSDKKEEEAEEEEEEEEEDNLTYDKLFKEGE